MLVLLFAPKFHSYPFLPCGVCHLAQVEHGITEMAHGNIDVVEAQLRLQLPGLAPEGGAEALLASLAAAPAVGCSIEVRGGGRAGMGMRESEGCSSTWGSGAGHAANTFCGGN